VKYGSATARVDQLPPESEGSLTGESATLPTIGLLAEALLVFRKARRTNPIFMTDLLSSAKLRKSVPFK
jgi:hypothetical protein